MRQFLLIAVLAVTVAACAGRHNGPDPALALRHLRLYSPNGEPLSGGPLGHPSCEAALAGWFDRLDPSHQGKVSQAVFLADTAAQFDRMDLDHDGQITPAELASFRAPYDEPLMAEPVPRPRPDAVTAGGQGDAPFPGERGDGRGRRGMGDGGWNQPTAQPLPHRANSVDISADPVMAADTGLRFRVSRDEFLAQAGSVFARLDADRDGWLSRDEAVQACPAPPPQ